MVFDPLSSSKELREWDLLSHNRLWGWETVMNSARTDRKYTYDTSTLFDYMTLDAINSWVAQHSWTFHSTLETPSKGNRAVDEEVVTAVAS